MSGLAVDFGGAGERAVLAAVHHRARVAYWTLRILLTLLILAVLSGVYWLMWRGWKNRAARQADLPIPPSAAPDGSRFGEAVEGVHPAPGIAGKVIGGAGMVLVTWRLGDRVLDTGFHPRAKGGHARLLDQVYALLTERTMI